jgi:hypothetical protein
MCVACTPGFKRLQLGMDSVNDLPSPRSISGPIGRLGTRQLLHVLFDVEPLGPPELYESSHQEESVGHRIFRASNRSPSISPRNIADEPSRKFSEFGFRRSLGDPFARFFQKNARALRFTGS